MAGLDVGKAAVAGFGVIGRNPLAVLVWGLVILVVGILPVALLMGGAISTIMQLAALEEQGVEPDPAAIMPLMSTMMLMYPLLFIISVALRAVLSGAMFRAVLEPEDRRWFYLRLGAQELWLGLVAVVVSILAGMAGGVLGLLFILPVAMLGVASEANGGGGGGAGFAVGVLFVGLLGLAAIAAFVWVALRFSMALPMSFAQRQFRLFESWALTRGRVGGLLLMSLLLFLIVVAVEIVLWIVFMVALGLFGAAFIGTGGHDEKAIEAFFQQSPAVLMATVAPWLVIGAVVVSVVGSALMTIFTAPWAEAYRQFTTGAATKGDAAPVAP